MALNLIQSRLHSSDWVNKIAFFQPVLSVKMLARISNVYFTTSMIYVLCVCVCARVRCHILYKYNQQEDSFRRLEFIYKFSNERKKKTKQNKNRNKHSNKSKIFIRWNNAFCDKLHLGREKNVGKSLALWVNGKQFSLSAWDVTGRLAAEEKQQRMATWETHKIGIKFWNAHEIANENIRSMERIGWLCSVEWWFWQEEYEADGSQNCKLRLTNPIKSNKIKQLCIAC